MPLTFKMDKIGLKNENSGLYEMLPCFSSGEVYNAVVTWLTNHPEQTTTVINKSISKEKLTDDLLLCLENDYITPQMYGALGNGSHDDTNSIQAAMDAAGEEKKTLYFPNGDYRITDTLYLKYSYAVIKGSNNSIITKDFDGNIIENAPGKTVTDVKIERLNLFGNNREGHGIYTYRDLANGTRCGAILLRELFVTRNKGSGIKLSDNYCAKIVDCNVYNNSIGIDLVSANGTSIKECEFYGNDYGVIATRGTFALSIMNCVIQAQKVCAVLFGSCYAGKISGNYFEYNTGDVILFTDM